MSAGAGPWRRSPRSYVPLALGPVRFAFENIDPEFASEVAYELGAGRVSDPGRPTLRIDGAKLLAARGAGRPRATAHLLLLELANACQRQLLFLHGSAVARGEQAVAFVGPSGAGKTTAALIAVEHGARLLTDDVTLLERGSGLIHPIDRPASLREPTLRLIAERCPHVRERLGGAGSRSLRALTGEAPSSARLTRVVLLCEPGSSSAGFVFQHSFGALADHRVYFQDLLEALEGVEMLQISPLRLDAPTERKGAVDRVLAALDAPGRLAGARSRGSRPAPKSSG